MLFSILFRIVCLTFIFSVDYFISYLDYENHRRWSLDVEAHYEETHLFGVNK